MKSIPKVIHYCWFGPKPYSKTINKCINSWKKQLGDYELCFWNEDNSPMDIPFIRHAYLEKKYAFVSDCVRFHALYSHGGIYLDTDMFVLKRFDTLLSNETVFGWETGEEQYVSCGVIGAMPGNRFIGSILETYKSINFETTQLEKYVVPRVVNACYKDFKNKDQIRIYPFDYFYPFPYRMKEDVRNFMDYATPNTYAIHLWSISWGKWQAKLKDRVLYHLKLNR